jgi:hypothetical protein
MRCFIEQNYLKTWAKLHLWSPWVECSYEYKTVGIHPCGSSQINLVLLLNDPCPAEDAEILLICGGREHANSLESLMFRSTMLETPAGFPNFLTWTRMCSDSLGCCVMQQSCCDCDGPYIQPMKQQNNKILYILSLVTMQSYHTLMEEYRGILHLY